MSERKKFTFVYFLSYIVSCYAYVPPSYAPRSFDCKARLLAVDFGLSIRPNQDVCELWKVLRIYEDCFSECPTSKGHINHTYSSESYVEASNSKSVIYVDPLHGNDENNGSIRLPVASLTIGLNILRRTSSLIKELILRQGRYNFNETLLLDHRDNFLTIKPYKAETAILSGTYPLSDLVWEREGTVDFTTIWSAEVSHLQKIDALRLSNQRLVLARHPNANPEIYGLHTKPTGWINGAHTWFKRNTTCAHPLIVESAYNRSEYITTFPRYTVGVGGFCNGTFDPNVSFWCNPRNPRDGQHGLWNPPTGLIWKPGDLPIDENSPNSNLTDAIVHVWNRNHWATQMFSISEQSLRKRSIKWTRGGFQDARASSTGAEYYIENAFPFLDTHGEFYFCKNDRRLFVAWENSSSPPSNGFRAVITQELVVIDATKEKPAVNLSIVGLIFQDTAPTYLSPHGVPSGGDWALERSAALHIQGTVNFLVQDCSFSRLDGNALMLSKFNRNASIIGNRFRWIGGTAMSAWGWTNEVKENGTLGYDGTEGLYPCYTRVWRNLALDVGIFQKQSAAWFQAKAMQTALKYNIFANGPRGGIVINDGFGGGNEIEQNLVFNFCRESTDHGPFNSWDRQLFLFRTHETARPTYVPLPSIILRNMFIANYRSTMAIDHDDGSGWYIIDSNVVVYGTTGAKQDFGGHDLNHTNNLYAYISSACYMDYRGGEPVANHRNSFNQNTCVQAFVDQPYASLNCNDLSSVPYFYGNTVFTKSGKSSVCGLSHDSWQKKGFDFDTQIIKGLPRDDVLILLAREKLRLEPADKLQHSTVGTLFPVAGWRIQSRKGFPGYRTLWHNLHFCKFSLGRKRKTFWIRRWKMILIVKDERKGTRKSGARRYWSHQPKLYLDE